MGPGYGFLWELNQASGGQALLLVFNNYHEILNVHTAEGSPKFRVSSRGRGLWLCVSLSGSLASPPIIPCPGVQKLKVQPGYSWTHDPCRLWRGAISRAIKTTMATEMLSVTRGLSAAKAAWYRYEQRAFLNKNIKCSFFFFLSERPAGLS